MTRRASNTAEVPTVLMLVLLLALAGCGIPLDDQTHAIADSDVPFELLDPAPTTSSSTSTPPGSTTAAPETVTLYLVHNDRIERRSRSVQAPVGIEDRLRYLADVLPADDSEAGYRSAVPPGAFTSPQPSPRGGVATVDLSADFFSIPTKEQVLAFAQITYTLTNLQGIGQVAFTSNGAAISALDDEGVSVSGSVTADTYRDLLASR